MHPLISISIQLDPSLILDELGITPDAWQRRVLRSRSERMLLNCHRQAGKSTATAGLAINTVLQEDDALVLVVSASLRQSKELFRKIVRAYAFLGSPIPTVEDNAVTLALANGSRVVSLPDNDETLVGYSAPRLIIIDEGALTSDATAMAVQPMLAISRGRLVAMSTPRGRRGWFSDAWHDQGDSWERIEFKAIDNPRIDPAWLAEQRIILGPRWFGQEFCCEFNEGVGQVFSDETIDAAFSSDRPALFGSLAS